MIKINEIIEERMNHKGVNQTMVSNECGLSCYNFSAFLKGKRMLPKKNINKVMDFLGLVFKKGKAIIAPSNIEEEIGKMLAQYKDDGLKNLSERTGISESTLYYILNGKRNISTKNIYNLLDVFGIEIQTKKKVVA